MAAGYLRHPTQALGGFPKALLWFSFPYFFNRTQGPAERRSFLIMFRLLRRGRYTAVHNPRLQQIPVLLQPHLLISIGPKSSHRYSTAMTTFSALAHALMSISDRANQS